MDPFRKDLRKVKEDPGKPCFMTHVSILYGIQSTIQCSATDLMVKFKSKVEVARENSRFKSKEKCMTCCGVKTSLPEMWLGESKD